MKLAAALALTALLLPTSLYAETYRWTDDRGTVHLTEDWNSIPVAHRPEQVHGKARGSFSNLGATRRPDEIPFEKDGHLIKVMVRLNGNVVAPFYVDTGSSDIVLPESVAARLGVHPDPRAGHVALETSVGRIHVPALQLDSVQLGGHRVEGLWAVVAPSNEVGLLGGAFLNQFRYSIDPVTQTLTLTPRAEL